MKRIKRNNNLFAPQRRGGVIGGGGYNFQDAYIVAHLPEWLERPDFHSLLKEGFEDVDVRFENDGSSETWHYQIKDHLVRKAEFKKVLKGFKDIDEQDGVHATRFVLGCCGIGQDIAALWRRILEFRGASKSLSEGQLKTTKRLIIAECRRLGISNFTDLMFEKLTIDADHADLRGGPAPALAERFRGKFIRLALYRNEAASVIDELLTKLALLVNQSIRVGITRPELERLIISELAKSAKGPAFVVYLHGWSVQAYGTAADAVINWTDRFDRSTLKIPSPTVWKTKLLPELKAVRERCVGENKRNVWLFSKAPLSAGLAFGYVFSAAEGYNIRIEQPTPGSSDALQYWQTDDLVDPKLRVHTEQAAGQAGNAEDIGVAIGVTGDPRPNVETFLANSGLDLKAIVYITPIDGAHETSLNAKTVAAFARAAKEHIRTACQKQHPRRIHLFYFGPLGLAVLLGQKLNGLVDIQCYERSKTKGYARSCVLPA